MTTSRRRWSLLKSAQRRLRDDLGLPRFAAYRVVRTAAALSAPREILRRRRAATRLAEAGVGAPEIPRELGFRAFGAAELAGASQAAEHCRRVFADLRERGAGAALRAGSLKQEFLVPLLRGAAFADHPELLEFLLSRTVLRAVTRYFGTIPVLAKVSLLWSPVNDTQRSSQLFHHDLEDREQLKLFLHAFDVDDDAGPFTLLPAETSSRIVRRLGYSGGRIDDDAVARLGESGAVTPISGPAGSGVFVDTSRCLHFGSRGNRRERLVLMAQYLRYDAPNFKPTRLSEAVAATGIDLDSEQRMLLPV